MGFGICVDYLKIIKKKGEVIIPSWTWVSTANAVLNTGNTPVFADVEINSRNLTAKEIKSHNHPWYHLFADFQLHRPLHLIHLNLQIYDMLVFPEYG